MDKILGSVGIKIPFLKDLSICDDDSIDRLSHRVTVILLIVFSIIVSSKQFVGGSSINCWTPAHFTDDQIEYTNDFCWLKNTYHLPHEEDIPAHDERDNIPYYQWVSLILLLQALLFYLPFVAWNAFSRHSGVDVRSLVVAGNVFVATEMMEVREKTLSHMTIQLDRYLGSISTRERLYDLDCTLSIRHLFTRCQRCCGTQQYGHGLCVMYLFVKLLYVCNAVAQLFLLDPLLGFSFHSYGADVLSEIVAGNKNWSETSARFPRTAMCDLKVRRLGDVHRYSVECVLAINLFNEKIFLFLWFWLIAIIFITSVSFFIWLLRIVRSSERLQYVKHHLHLNKLLKSSQESKKARKFVERYLRADGVFILRILGKNTDTITVTEFISNLWLNYKERSSQENNNVESFDDRNDDGGSHRRSKKEKWEGEGKKRCCC